MTKSNATSRKNPRVNQTAARAHTAYVAQDPAETLENCRHVLAFCQTVDMAALPQQPMMASGRNVANLHASRLTQSTRDAMVT